MTVAAVIDTNVIISGFLWQGLPYKILRMAEDGDVGFFTSIPLMDELVRTLSRPKFFSDLTALNWTPHDIRDAIECIATIVEPAESFKVIVAADPSDDVVILTAVSAQAEFAVSGNKHLLNISTYKGIRIVTPSDFFKIVHSRK
jgi:uncharacterized protein